MLGGRLAHGKKCWIHAAEVLKSGDNEDGNMLSENVAVLLLKWLTEWWASQTHTHFIYIYDINVDIIIFALAMKTRYCISTNMWCYYAIYNGVVLY